MTLLQLCRNLAEARVAITLTRQGQLWMTGGYTPVIREAVGQRKPEIIGLLDDQALRATFGVPLGVAIDGALAVQLLHLRLERDSFMGEERELWIERAAIREYDGMLPRWEAEALAARDVVALRKLPRRLIRTPEAA